MKQIKNNAVLRNMKSKFKTVFIFILLIRLCFSGPVNYLSAETVTGNKNEDINTAFEAEENYSSKTGVSGTITAEHGSYLLNVMDFRNDPSSSRENKTVYNFYSPGFTSGRVRKKGLFKESANPSSWFAGSCTYTDQTEIGKDLQLERNGNWGFVIHTPELVTVYALADENNNYRIEEKGGGLNYRFSDKLDCSAVFSESEKKESKDESWYRNRDIEYGEHIYHCASRAVYKTGKVNCSASTGVSYGECFRTGKYVRYQPEIILGTFTVFLLYSSSDRYYRKPEKGYPPVKERRGIKGVYEAGRYLVFESGYNADIYHHEYLSDIDNRISERIFFKTKYDAESHFINFNAERKNTVKEREYINEDSLGVKTGIRGDFLKYSVNPEYIYYDYRLSEKRIVLEASVSDSKRKIFMRYKKDKGERTEALLKGGIEFKGENMMINSEAEYETVDENGINLKSVFRYSAGITLQW